MNDLRESIDKHGSRIGRNSALNSAALYGSLRSVRHNLRELVQVCGLCFDLPFADVCASLYSEALMLQNSITSVLRSKLSVDCFYDVIFFRPWVEVNDLL